jgi:hypothetical protein
VIGVMPSGGLVPKIVATMKWPTRAFNLVAPVSSSFLKCLRSEFRLIGLSLRFRTTKQMFSSGIPRLAITSTFFRCSSVGRNAGRPLVAITALEYAFFRGFAHPRNHLFKLSGEPWDIFRLVLYRATEDSDAITDQSFTIDGRV